MVGCRYGTDTVALAALDFFEVGAPLLVSISGVARDKLLVRRGGDAMFYTEALGTFADEEIGRDTAKGQSL